jgi:hypothetical protein
LGVVFQSMAVPRVDCSAESDESDDAVHCSVDDRRIDSGDAQVFDTSPAMALTAGNVQPVKLPIAIAASTFFAPVGL